MYIKSLKILNGTDVVREVKFRLGLNLIVDSGTGSSGNDVGKTTFLRLVDFCLGGDAKVLYSQSGNSENEKVKDFLFEKNILIELTLINEWSKDSQEYIIRRNFALNKRDYIFEVNGTPVSSSPKKKKRGIGDVLFSFTSTKPTFRQLIHHNFRCYEYSFGDPLRLNAFSRDEDYEALYLYMFGTSSLDAKEKIKLSDKLNLEIKFKQVLEKEINIEDCEKTIAELNNEISLLKNRVDVFYINEQVSFNLSDLRQKREEMRITSGELARLRVKENIVSRSISDFEHANAILPIGAIRDLYSEAKILFPAIQKKFEDLVAFHNGMISEKIELINEELKEIKNQIEEKDKQLNELKLENDRIVEQYEKNITTLQLKDDMNLLAQKMADRQDFQSKINQLRAREASIDEIQKRLDKINQKIHSKDFSATLETNIKRFNEIFLLFSEKISNSSNELIFNVNENGVKKIYKFSLRDPDFSDGAKHKVTFCFDLAYAVYARELNLPHLDFFLHDRNESVDDNQLIEMSNLAVQNSAQWIVSILLDKLPTELSINDNIVLQLSDTSKLFRIEELS